MDLFFFAPPEPLAARSQVRAARPDFGALASLLPAPPAGRGVCITAAGGAGAGELASVDFSSRWFAPRGGLVGTGSEDSTTGTAHCYLAPLWASRLGKSLLEAAQLRPRAGRLACVVSAASRVALLGACVCTLKGVVVAQPPAANMVP